MSEFCWTSYATDFRALHAWSSKIDWNFEDGKPGIPASGRSLSSLVTSKSQPRRSKTWKVFRPIASPSRLWPFPFAVQHCSTVLPGPNLERSFFSALAWPCAALTWWETAARLSASPSACHHLSSCTPQLSWFGMRCLSPCAEVFILKNDFAMQSKDPKALRRLTNPYRNCPPNPSLQTSEPRTAATSCNFQ